MLTFAEQLNAMRKERHITQEELAQELNVSRTTISRWESGKVLPDIETIKHLSQVLNYNFFAVEGLTEEQCAVPMDKPMPEEHENSVPPTVRNSRLVWGLAIGCLCLLVLCLILLFERYSDESVPGIQPTAKPASTETSNAFKETTQQPAAEIKITPSNTAAYLKVIGVEDGEEVYGWRVEFIFENKSDIPFTIEKIVGDYYENDTLRFSIPVLYEQLRPNMANDKLLNINDPLRWSFGSDQYYLTRMVCTIYGTDDNGNKIEASATVQYVPELEGAANNP